jgi:hypothetical protein
VRAPDFQVLTDSFQGLHDPIYDLGLFPALCRYSIRFLGLDQSVGGLESQAHTAVDPPYLSVQVQETEVEPGRRAQNDSVQVIFLPLWRHMDALA